MNGIAVKQRSHDEIKVKFLPSFKTLLKPVLPASVLFLITFVFTILFSQFSRLFLESNSINYVNRGLVLATIFAFVLLTIKFTSIIKQKTEQH